MTRKTGRTSKRRRMPRKAEAEEREETVEEFERSIRRRFEAMREETRPKAYQAAQLMQHVYGNEALNEARRRLGEAERQFDTALRAVPLDTKATGHATVQIWIWPDIILALQTLESSAPEGGRA